MNFIRPYETEIVGAFFVPQKQGGETHVDYPEKRPAGV